MKVINKLKLSVSFIFLLLLLCSWLGMNHVASYQRDQLLQLRFEQLVSLREALSSHIKDYEKATVLAAETIAHDRTVHEALAQFTSAYQALESSGLVPESSALAEHYQHHFVNKINTDVPNTPPTRSIDEYLPASKQGQLLQQQFLMNTGVLDDQPYTKVYQAFNDYLYPLVGLHGFYDLFLIDAQGNVVYSAIKEVDLGTNLLTGPYQNSGLATVFKASRTLPEMSFTHAPYRAYEPSFNKPASFIGMPIYWNNQYIGSIAIELPIEPVNNIMTFNGQVEDSGLGDTGEVYLVGDDFTMRNDSRFIANMDEPLVTKLGTTIGVQEVKTQAVMDAREGKKGSGVIDDYRQESVLSAYAPLNLFGEPTAIVAEIDHNTVVGAINKAVNSIMFKLGALALLTWGLLVLFFDQLMMRPLRKINVELEHEVLEKEKKVMVSLSLLNEYKRAVDVSSVVSKTDKDGTLTYANDAFSEASGYPKQELIGKKFDVLAEPRLMQSVYNDLWRTVSQKKIWKGILCNQNKNGQEYYVSSTVVPILSMYGNIQEYITIGTDITELYLRREEMLRHTVDDLTKLPNRQKFLADLSEVAVPRVVAIMNIDRFSEVNNFYGYEAGDELLVKMAKTLLGMANGEVKVYRLSGDEFGLLAREGCTSEAFKARCTHVLEQLSDVVFTVDDNELPISVTMGAAEETSKVYVNASMALRVAKESQKKILFYNSDIDLQRRTGENLRWTKVIKNAIEDDRIELYVQPIVNRITGGAEKYECLMRLIDENDAEISPFFFMDIAKHARLYPKLSEMIIRKSFEHFARRMESFAINLTIIDILNEHTVALLKRLIDQHAAAKRVILEIVESEGIENFEEVSAFIQDMKSLGCRVAIDDFGTGYSNFEYLMKLNPDFIKIDGSLVKNIVHDEGVYAIIKLINDFAKSIGAKTVAEFVSDQDIAMRLERIGVDYMQGYYYGKPVAPEVLAMEWEPPQRMAM